MIKIEDPKKCCGCTACASICPRNAISMEPDTLGFLYPQVDDTKCVNCGLCEKVCQFTDHYDRTNLFSEPKAYAARHKDINEVALSRSGAVFAAVSDWILSQNGAVYGAGYVDHFRVAHKRATTKSQRDGLRGSKYVQSDLTGIFHQIKNDLKSENVVLFSGTPCQIAGLKGFLRKDYDNLYLMDIVCHGVPGPFIWRDYLSYVEKKNNGIVESFNFRDKSELGWSWHKESFFLKNKKQKVYSFDYAKIIAANIILRKSCSQCPFTNVQRPADITIGDFWGWDRVDSEINKDDKGVSLVFVNSEKGSKIFDAIKDVLTYIPAKVSDCLQPNLQGPSTMHPKREPFEKYYAKYGFEAAIKKYCGFGWRGFVRRHLGALKRLVKGLK